MNGRNKMKVRKGDYVQVISGRDRGRKGDVIDVRPKERRVVVQGVNMIKRHRRATPTSPGGIDEREAAINVSNVALLDPKDGEPTRVGWKVLKDGRKVRFARRSGEVIDR